MYLDNRLLIRNYNCALKYNSMSAYTYLLTPHGVFYMAAYGSDYGKVLCRRYIYTAHHIIWEGQSSLYHK